MICESLDRQPHAQVTRQALGGILGDGGPGKLPARGDVFIVNGRLTVAPPAEGLEKECPATIWTDGRDVAAARLPVKVAKRWFLRPLYDPAEYSAHALLNVWNTVETGPSVRMLEIPGTLTVWPWDLIDRQSEAASLQLREHGAAIDGDIDARAILGEESNMFIAGGARVMAGAILDASGGPILIGDSAKIMPGAVVTGPAVIGAGTVIKPGAKLNGHVVAGPRCKLGGEIEDTVIQGFSNKQHDGFLGHALLGEWVNLGAGTNNSDLKNNYSPVSVTLSGEQISSERPFFGSVIGDHAKTAIGTQLNTGTVIGIGTNVFGAGFPPKDIGAFRWGGADGFQMYEFEKFIETARAVMKRREVEMSREMAHLLRHLHQEAVAGRI
jgi:UDP-N-acetylglucosamine diphosphorylase/glucosamine-1-phosphate N-acetyltransferase